MIDRMIDPQPDPEEIAEWVESFDQMVASGGRQRAAAVLQALGKRATASGVAAEAAITTDYINTVAVGDEPPFAGDEDIEHSFRRLIRWNAAVLVHRAQRPSIGVGGHISTYAGGPGPFRYLLYKDVNRHMKLHRRFD